MKMLYSLYARNGRKFFAPDTGGGTGGGTSSGTSQPSGGGQQQQSAPDPFAAIDLDSLDDNSRAALEKAKTEFATLQKTAAEKTREAQLHQSERDKLQARLNHTAQTASGQQQQQGPVTSQQRVYAQLVATGMPAEQAQAQAQTLGKILESERQAIQQEIGAQMQPLVGNVLQQTASTSFQEAVQGDKIGWSQHPEVSQLVWQSCVEMARAGTQIDSATVKNLAAMHFMAAMESNPAIFASLQIGANQPNSGQVNPPVSPTPAFPPMPMFNTGGGWPGGNFAGRPPVAINPNAPRTVPDATTMNAIESVKNVWKGQGLKVG